ncbi:MAG: hypothetical protein RL684_301 [Pseudomonadota bacterium]|jgi:glycerol kinase
MSVLLAIDQSTSATKAVCFDIHGTVLARAAREHRQYYPRPGWVEHDAEEIWRNLLAVVGELCERQPQLVRRLACVSLCNQRETVVVFDATTGQPLHPAIVWQCRRGDALCVEQRSAGREEAVRTRTGLPIDGYFTAPKLQWLVREKPAIAARLADGSARVGTIDTYLLYRMTGGATCATDVTNASRTLLFDIRTLDWDPQLCDWWQVPRNALPEARSCDAAFGETTFDGLLPAAVPIRGVMGDSQAALFAQRCHAIGAAKATIGSGSSILVNAGPDPPQNLRGAVAALAWVIGSTPTYAVEGLINHAGSTLAWLREQLRLFADVAECESLANQAEGDSGVYLVPAFSGLSAPYWQPAARAAIVGLSAHSDRRHVIRAGLESIAYQLRDVIDMLQAETGLAIGRLCVDGGASANRLLMQITADLLGIEIAVSDMPDGSALGAAWMGALGLGLHRTLADVTNLPLDAVCYSRQMQPQVADARYAGWRRAVGRVL